MCLRLSDYKVLHNINFARILSLFSLVFRTSNFWSWRNLIKQLFYSRLLDMRLVIANSAPRASQAIYHLISTAHSWNIPARLLKCVANELANPVSWLFNLLFTRAIVPQLIDGGKLTFLQFIRMVKWVQLLIIGGFHYYLLLGSVKRGYFILLYMTRFFSICMIPIMAFWEGGLLFLN